MIAYIMANLWLLWLLVGIVCLLLELTSGDLFILCFAIGSVAASIVAACGGSIVMQIIVGVAVSVLSLFFVRPAALKWLHRNEDSRLSNVEALIGRKGVVTETIVAGGYGRVAVDGDDWKAQSSNGEEIAKGTKVCIVSMESIIVTVETAG